MFKIYNIFILIIIVSELTCTDLCYIVKKKIGGKNGLAKKKDTSLSFVNSNYKDEKKQGVKDKSISELDDSRTFYRKHGSRDALIVSSNWIYQKEFDAFENFWEKKLHTFKNERKAVLNQITPTYQGCLTDEGNFIYSRSFKIINSYSYPINTIKAKFNKNRIEQVNNHKFSRMNKIFEGIFKLIDKINEVEVSEGGGYDIPVLKQLNDLDIGLKRYDPDVGVFTENEIVFRDSSVLIDYIPDFFKALLSKFKDFGNFADVDENKLRIINLFQLYEYWEKSIKHFFPLNFEMSNCLTQRDNKDPFFVLKCPSLIVNLLKKLDDEEYKTLKFLGLSKFPTDYPKFKNALWKIIKLSSELNQAIRAKFEYTIPEFNRNEKIINIIFEDNSSFKKDNEEIQNFNLHIVI